MDAQQKTSGGGNHSEVYDSTTSDNSFCFPPPETVKGRVLADLLNGRCITHMDTWCEHGSSRLAHHIYMLRKAGWPIHCGDVEGTTHGGRAATIGRYSLTADTIRAAGMRGSRFVHFVLSGA